MNKDRYVGTSPDSERIFVMRVLEGGGWLLMKHSKLLALDKPWMAKRLKAPFVEAYGYTAYDAIMKAIHNKRGKNEQRKVQ